MNNKLVLMKVIMNEIFEVNELYQLLKQNITNYYRLLDEDIPSPEIIIQATKNLIKLFSSNGINTIEDLKELKIYKIYDKYIIFLYRGKELTFYLTVDPVEDNPEKINWFGVFYNGYHPGFDNAPVPAPGMPARKNENVNEYLFRLYNECKQKNPSLNPIVLNTWNAEFGGQMIPDWEEDMIPLLRSFIREEGPDQVSGPHTSDADIDRYIMTVDHGDFYYWLVKAALRKRPEPVAAGTGAEGTGAEGTGAAESSSRTITFYDRTAPYYEFTNLWCRNDDNPPSSNLLFTDSTVYKFQWLSSEHYFQVYKFLHRHNDDKTGTRVRTRVELQTLYDKAKDKPPGFNGGIATFEKVGPDWGSAVTQYNRIKINGGYWFRNGNLIPGNQRAMYNCVKEKFINNDDLMAKLLDTNNDLLVENAGSNDNKWGDGTLAIGSIPGAGTTWTLDNVGDLQGKNMLGLLLMELRDEFNVYRGLPHKNTCPSLLRKDESYCDYSKVPPHPRIDTAGTDVGVIHGYYDLTNTNY